MLENLKIAVKRQKRIILIFFLTILIPSVFLGIFGIRAIRNERYRVAKQLETEHRSAAEYFKSQVQKSFNELGTSLQNLAPSTSFMERDYPKIKNTLVTQLGDSPLIEYFFIAYDDEDPFFPQFQPVIEDKKSSTLRLTSSQLTQLRKAE